MMKFDLKWIERKALDGPVDSDLMFQLASKIDLPHLPPLPTAAGKAVLNLGCGKTQYGFRVDREAVYNPDLVIDLDAEQFPSAYHNTFLGAVAFHFLEHVKDLRRAMDEIWTVLKADSPLLIAVPYFKSDLAFQDLEHKTFFTEETFSYFTGEKAVFIHPQKRLWRLRHQELRGLTHKNLLMLTVLEKIAQKNG